jgi:uncharacterized RDD family membrane protein YckC
VTDAPVSAAQEVAAAGNGHVPDAAHRVHRRAAAAATPPGEPEPVYIGLVTRAIAFAIDAAIIDGIAILVAAASALIISILPASDNFKTISAVVGGVLFVVWTFAYFASFWSATGQTPGNRVMRIRVTRLDGTLLGPLRGAARCGGVVLAALPLLLGFAPILFNEQRRGLQDAIAGTVVVSADDGPARR